MGGQSLSKTLCQLSVVYCATEFQINFLLIIAAAYDKELFLFRNLKRTQFGTSSISLLYYGQTHSLPIVYFWEYLSSLY